MKEALGSFFVEKEFGELPLIFWLRNILMKQ